MAGPPCEDCPGAHFTLAREAPQETLRGVGTCGTEIKSSSQGLPWGSAAHGLCDHCAHEGNDVHDGHRRPGKLSTMARPRGGEWLADEMASLREPGTDVLVCMLTTSELRELELTEEAAVAEAAGLRFMRFPRTAYFSMQIGAERDGSGTPGAAPEGRPDPRSSPAEGPEPASYRGSGSGQKSPPPST